MTLNPDAAPATEGAAEVVAAREAAFLNPNDARAQARLGRACLDAGNLALAIEALQRATRLDPENASVRINLARAWMAAADPDKALFHLRRAVELESGDSAATRALQAEIEARTGELSPVFVRNLFDQYAERFDAEVESLGYRAPEALRDLMLRVVGVPGGGLDILDLGCGTGLSGLAVRDFARTLVGVDLSPAMADKARSRGIYNQVIVGDMVSAMSGAPASFNLVVAADALGYVGDLGPLLRAAQSALRPGGRFAATVEESADADFVLGPARRYRHSANYVRSAAQAAGFANVALEKAVLRRDRGQPVTGLLFVLARQN